MERKISELSIDELTKYKKEQQEEIDKISIEYSVIINQMTNLSQTMKKIDEALDDATLTIDNISEILEKFPETKKRRKLLEEYLHSLNLNDGGGYWINTNQSAIRIMLYKYDDEHTKKVYEGILEILPYIKPIKDNTKQFDIFEYTLSLHDSYYLAYNEQTKLFSVITGRKNIIKENEDLMKILKYIQENLYYEEKNPFVKG